MSLIRDVYHAGEQEKLTNKVLTSAENPEDIYPYATFCLPENQQVPQQMGTMGTYREMPGTVGHMDMLILHQNQTLPLSDANSKSVSDGISNESQGLKNEGHSLSVHAGEEGNVLAEAETALALSDRFR